MVIAPNGSRYIGVAKSIPKRIIRHRNTDSYLGRSLRKHGADAHTIEVLATCSSYDRAYVFEKRAIESYGTLSPAGMNLAAGGLGGKTPTAETWNRRSAVHKGRKKPKGFSRKVSEAHTGRKRSEGACENMRLSHLGKHHSEETKAKMRAAKVGKPKSAETKRRMSDAKRVRCTDPIYRVKLLKNAALARAVLAARRQSNPNIRAENHVNAAFEDRQ